MCCSVFLREFLSKLEAVTEGCELVLILWPIHPVIIKSTLHSSDLQIHTMLQGNVCELKLIFEVGTQAVCSPAYKSEIFAPKKLCRMA